MPPASPNILLMVIVLSFASAILVLYFGFRLFLTIGKIRRESKRSAEQAARNHEEWQEFRGKQDQALGEARQKLTNDIHRVADRSREKIAEFEESVGATEEHLEKLERYLREFFEVEMKNIFDSFDSTVSTVLSEMREQLLRGLKNIDEIQSVVESRVQAQDRVLEGAFTAERLLEGKEPEEPAEAFEAEEGETDAIDISDQPPDKPKA